MRILQGTVTNLKMQKTVTVTISRYKKHPKYQKRYLVSKKYLAHYEGETPLQLGETVLMLETKPMSKLKRWRIVTPEQAEKLIAKSQVELQVLREENLKRKNLKDEKTTTLSARKRKLNSNKRKAQAAAAPAESAATPEAPAAPAPASQN